MDKLCVIAELVLDPWSLSFDHCLCSGGFRNLERGVQPLAREAQPKILGVPRPLPARKTSELNISKQLWPSQTSGDQ